MRLGEQIKGVIFDIDGVLIDSMEIWTDLGARYVTGFGKEPEEGLAGKLFSMSMEQGAEYLREHYLPEKTADEILAGLSGMLRDFYYHEVKAKPGAGELMKQLHTLGIKMTAATSSPRDHVEKALERNGMLTYIERIFTCAEVKASKHTPVIYNEAARFMGLEPDKVCVFEDSLYAALTAAAAGYHTVGVYDEKGEPDQTGLSKAVEIYVRDLRNL